MYHFSYEPCTKRALGTKGYQIKFENYVSNLRPNVNKKLYGIALQKCSKNNIHKSFFGAEC